MTRCATDLCVSPPSRARRGPADDQTRGDPDHSTRADTLYLCLFSVVYVLSINTMKGHCAVQFAAQWQCLERRNQASSISLEGLFSPLELARTPLAYDRLACDLILMTGVPTLSRSGNEVQRVCV